MGKPRNKWSKRQWTSLVEYIFSNKCKYSNNCIIFFSFKINFLFFFKKKTIKYLDQFHYTQFDTTRIDLFDFDLSSCEANLGSKHIAFELQSEIAYFFYFSIDCLS